MQNQFSLLTKVKFLPLFITQFMGAFNDNVFKNSILILITYALSDRLTYNVESLVVIAAGIFILPMVLFSSTAGQLADKYEKSKLIRIIKFAEIIIMFIACLGFYLENVHLLIVVLFAMGTQSTFFGPLKYSILPTHLKQNELISGNALIEAATFLAILLGTLCGTLLILQKHGVLIISISIITIAFLGWLASLRIPQAIGEASDLKLDWNIVRTTWQQLKYSTQSKNVFLAILGISWFWFVGASYLAQFPPFVKNIIKGSEDIVALFLTTFSIGIGLGSLFCNKLLKGEVKATFVPLAALGLSGFGIDLYYTIKDYMVINSEQLLTVYEFLQVTNNWKMLVDLLGIAICGGIYIVPLYAILQTEVKASNRARMIAVNNIMNALFMVISAAIISAMLQHGFGIPEIFLKVSLGSTVVAVLLCKLLPNQKYN